jgi:signal transduction histidine kinase
LRVDVTELEVAKQEAEAANMAKTEFLGTLSHELRTPLTVILGHARLAQSLEKLPQARELRKALEQEASALRLTKTYDDLLASVSQMMGKLERSGSHLLTLVNELLDFAKIESGTMTIDAQEHPLDAVVRPVEEQVRELIERKGLTFSVSSFPGHVMCDEVRMRQILFNLLGNALKFTAAGQISLDVKSDEKAVTFSVSDSGIGIPPEQLESIFEAFHQVDTGLKRANGGTGLGLAISRRLAEAQGGSLSATSEIDKGSTFVLTLPVAGKPDANDGKRSSVRVEAFDLAS